MFGILVVIFLYILIKKRRLTPTDIHLPPKIDVSHLHIFEEAVFCRKTIKILLIFIISRIFIEIILLIY
ncbi:hypothetical protein CON53_08295 [Bacillus cereus]|nr:hypothetical protein CON53_08295 [Bacillus cereus]PFH82862.1 hypothetical protein COI81_26515 [Bacillus cereus]PFM53223.1 hypothetical protein COJ52_24545 [Bacillus cereus]PFR99854.1 hypothetical protein COK55_32420 [Bacillus cereus]PGS23874.1 hypothetical protein COC55_18540 [Bacillus cereus]